MNSEYDLDRFLSAQKNDYQVALQEIKAGRKRSHWIWYIFPQIQGLGFSEISKFYAIKNLAEATNYFHHPILGPRLIEISSALLSLDQKDALSIFGSPDYLKLKSCATLFASVEDTSIVFEQILQTFFNGDKDENTLTLILLEL